VLNKNEALSQEDCTLYEEVKNEDVIVIVNKMDLEHNIDSNEDKNMIGDTPLIKTTKLKKEGIDELKIQIQDMLFDGEVQNQDKSYVSNSRHISLLKQASQTIQDEIDAAESGVPMEMV
ncbi:tRNA modification GTPase, partial [Staphylococcus aureus]